MHGAGGTTVPLLGQKDSLYRDSAKIYCARVVCVTFLKVLIFCGCVQLVILYGLLSKPLWIPNNPSAACEVSDDKHIDFQQIGRGFRGIGTLEDCESLCENFRECHAVDYYRDTSFCNLYDAPCSTPMARWDNASSYLIAQACRLNGADGIVIAGRCNTTFTYPSFQSVVVQQVPHILQSPRSWLITLALALVYTYLVSQRLRSQVHWLCCKQRNGAATGMLPRSWGRHLVLACAAVALWLDFTIWTWGLSPFVAPHLAPNTVQQAEQRWIISSLVVIATFIVVLICFPNRHSLDGDWLFGTEGQEGSAWYVIKGSVLRCNNDVGVNGAIRCHERAQAILETVPLGNGWNEVLEEKIKIALEKASRERLIVHDCNNRDLGLTWQDHGKPELRHVPETKDFPLQIKAATPNNKSFHIKRSAKSIYHLPYDADVVSILGEDAERKGYYASFKIGEHAGDGHDVLVWYPNEVIWRRIPQTSRRSIATSAIRYLFIIFAFVTTWLFFTITIWGTPAQRWPPLTIWAKLPLLEQAWVALTIASLLWTLLSCVRRGAAPRTQLSNNVQVERQTGVASNKFASKCVFYFIKILRMIIIVVATLAWMKFSIWEFGPPRTVWPPQLVWRNMPHEEQAWCLGTLVVLLLLQCKKLRLCLCTSLACCSTALMAPFTACFNLLCAGVFEAGAFAATAVGGLFGASTAVAETAGAAALADVGVSAEAAIAADAATAAGAAAEASVAAETAAAAEAAAAASAAVDTGAAMACIPM